MPVRYKISGSDYSASVLPKFKKQVAGFDIENLHALWLFENGALDANMATALDSSGNGNNGSLANGSVTPVKKATGVYADNPYKFIMPGRTFAQTPFSFAMVLRLDQVRQDTNTSYPTFWRPLSSLASGSVVNTGSGNTPPALLLHCLNRTLTEGSAAPTYRLYGQVPNPITGAPSGAGSDILSFVSQYTSHVAVAVAYDPATNLFKLVHGGGVLTRPDNLHPDFIAALEASVSQHIFGFARWNIGVENPPKGTLSGMAFYNAFMSDADLQGLRAKLASRVAARGVVVI